MDGQGESLLLYTYLFSKKKKKVMKSVFRDFPGGTVVKNLPSNEGDVGSSPGWGTKIPHAAGQLSLTSEFREMP